MNKHFTQSDSDLFQTIDLRDFCYPDVRIRFIMIEQSHGVTLWDLGNECRKLNTASVEAAMIQQNTGEHGCQKNCTTRKNKQEYISNEKFSSQFWLCNETRKCRDCSYRDHSYNARKNKGHKAVKC